MPCLNKVGLLSFTPEPLGRVQGATDRTSNPVALGSNFVGNRPGPDTNPYDLLQNRKKNEFQDESVLNLGLMDYVTQSTLLLRVSEGVDPSAWIEFHERYANLIRGFAIRMGLQSSDCDDVVQEVLLALAKSMQTFEYDRKRGKFRSYLKTLVIRAVSRKFRQERRQVALGDIDVEADGAGADPAHESIWENEWRRHHVRRAMGRLKSELSDRDRMAFSLYAMGGGSAADTAQALSMSVDQVYQVKSRTLKRLSELIAEQVRDEG